MILDDVIAALVARFDAAVTATVYDGPVPTAVNKGNFVLVGATGDEGDIGATVDQTLSTLGPGTWLEEVGEIVCSFWSWDGGTDVAARRTAALANANACAAAVHEDRQLGGLIVPPGIAEVSAFSYQAQQTNKGALCRITFSVTYRHTNNS